MVAKFYCLGTVYDMGHVESISPWEALKCEPDASGMQANNDSTKMLQANKGNSTLPGYEAADDRVLAMVCSS